MCSANAKRGFIIEQQLLDWLDQYREQALWLIPLLAFAEACVGLGLIVSGAFLVIVATTLLTTETATLAQMVPLAFAGALLGDHVGFFVGRRIGPGFHHMRLVRRYPDQIRRGEDLIRRHAGMTIFIGRFIPAIRSIIPALLGISGYPRQRYSLLDATACLLWSLVLAALVQIASTLV